jgi:periplasmic protein TonB
MARVRRAFLLTAAAAVLAAAGAGWESRQTAAPQPREPETVAAPAGAPGPAGPSAQDEGDNVLQTFPPPSPSQPVLHPGGLRTAARGARREATSPSVPPSQKHTPVVPPAPPVSAPAASPADRDRAPVTPEQQVRAGAPSAEIAPPPAGESDGENPNHAQAPASTPAAGDSQTTSPAAGSGPGTAAGTRAPEGSDSPAPSSDPLRSDAASFPSRVTSPRVLSTSGMDYPGEAFHFTVRRQDLGSGLAVVGSEGTVALRALVRADGTVGAVEVTASSGSAVLDQAAADAVARWHFAPAARDGVSIDAYVTLRIRYVVR